MYKWLSVILILAIFALSGCTMTKTCPECPPPTEWTLCSDFQQNRTTYYCDFTTNFECKERNETKTCIPQGQESQYIQKNYTWYFEGRKWDWQPVFSITLYNYYKSKQRPATVDYSVYATDSADDYIIEHLVDIFKKTGFENYKLAEFVVTFVQSLPYIPDNLTEPLDEWPKYPIETLVDGGGDCEDTSILAAVLLNELGIDVVLVEFPNHMGIGVLCEGNGTYFEKDGKKYCYLETTGKNWKIGEIPKEYAGQAAYIFYLVKKPVLRHFSLGEPISYGYNTVTFRIDVRVWNEGTADAENLVVWAGFDSQEEGMVFVQNKTSLPKLHVGENITISLPLTLKRGVYTRLHVAIWADNAEMQESFSQWSEI